MEKQQQQMTDYIISFFAGIKHKQITKRLFRKPKVKEIRSWKRISVQVKFESKEEKDVFERVMRRALVVWNQDISMLQFEEGNVPSEYLHDPE